MNVSLRRSSLVSWSILAGVFLLHLLVFSRIHRDWWYIDDPGLYASVRDHSPGDFFFSRDLIRGIGAGRLFTPLQQLGMWADYKLAPRSATLAYLHTVLSLALAIALMFHVSRGFFSEKVALACSCLWLFLCSTSAVTEWLAARHYLDGLVLVLASTAAWQAGQRANGARRVGFFVLALLFTFLAALAKELYVTQGFWLLLCLFLSRRQVVWSAILSLVAILFAAYRLWALGAVPLEIETPWHDLMAFFSQLPFFFAGAWTGYLLALAFLFLLAFASLRHRLSIRPLFFWISNLLVALLTILPLIRHLVSSTVQQGDWYRLLLVFNLLLLFMGAWLVERCAKPVLGVVALLLALAVLIPSSWQVCRNWDQRKAGYEGLGMFYLENPDRLLYPTLPGWFIPGIHRLYQPDAPVHYVSEKRTGQPLFDTLLRHGQVWTWKDQDGFQVRPLLHRRIWVNNTLGVAPLTSAIDTSDPNLLDQLTLQEIPVRIEDNKILVMKPDYLRDQLGGTLPVTGPEARSLLLFFDGGSQRDRRLLLYNGTAQANAIQVQLYENKKEQRAQLTMAPREQRLVPLAALFPEAEMAEVARLAITARFPLRAWSTYRVSSGAVRVEAAALPDQTGPAWIAHLPTSQGWHSQVLVYNGGQETRTAVVSLYMEGGGLPYDVSIKLAAGETRTIDPIDLIEDASLKPHSLVLNSEPPGLVVRGEMAIADRENRTVFQPRQSPANTFTLAPVVGDPAWRALVVFNASERETTVSLLGEAGTPISTHPLGPRNKLLLLLDAQASLLSATLPVSCLLVSQNKMKALIIVEPDKLLEPDKP